jgi:hypothetical protein
MWCPSGDHGLALATDAEMIASWISRSSARRSQASRAVSRPADRVADRLRRVVDRRHRPGGCRIRQPGLRRPQLRHGPSALLYFGLPWTRSGQTVGMGSNNIQMVDTRTWEPPSWIRAFLRALVAVLTFVACWLPLVVAFSDAPESNSRAAAIAAVAIAFTALALIGHLWALRDPHQTKPPGPAVRARGREDEAARRTDSGTAGQHPRLA